MGRAIGLNELAEHSVAGSVFAAFDKVESGEMGYEGGEVQENIGVGGQVEQYRDMVVPVGNVSTMLQDGALLSYIEPASIGALPTIIEKIQGGVYNVAGEGRLHEDCYIKTAKFSCANGGLVMVEYSWIALDETDGTTISSKATQSTTAGFPWHDEDPQFDSVALNCLSWEVTVDTGVSAQTDQDLKASGDQRLPVWIDPGPFKVDFAATVRAKRSFNFAADYPVAVGFAVSCNNRDGDVFALTMTGGSKIALNGNPLPLVADNEAVVYQINGAIKTNDLDAFTVSLTPA